MPPRPIGMRPLGPRSAAVAPSARGTNGEGAAKGPSAAKGVSNTDDARAAAAALEGKIAHEHQSAYAAWSRLADAPPKVAAMIAATKGAQKTDLEAKKKLLDRKVTETKRELDELGADGEALDNPGTARSE